MAVAACHLHATLNVPIHLKNAPLGVDFFFMLSGFVLAHAYSGSLAAGETFLDYLFRRIIRLYPLVVLGALTGAAVQHVLWGLSASTLIRLVAQGVVLVPELRSQASGPTFMPLDPPAWSLFFEMVASVLFGVGVWRGRLRSALAALVLASVAIGWAGFYYGSFDTGWNFESIGAGLARVTFAFGLGVLLQRAHRSGMRVPFRPTFWPVAGFFALLIFSNFSSLWFQFGCVFVLFPMIILLAAEIQPSKSAAFYRWSGELSFPLYILHWPVYLWVWTVADDLGVHRDPIMLSATALLAAVCAAYVAYIAFDRPIRLSLSKGLYRLARQAEPARSGPGGRFEYQSC